MAFCPNVSDSKVVTNFNSLLKIVGANPMTIEEFKDTKSIQDRPDIKEIDLAYYYWDKFEGEFNEEGLPLDDRFNTILQVVSKDIERLVEEPNKEQGNLRESISNIANNSKWEHNKEIAKFILNKNFGKNELYEYSNYFDQFTNFGVYFKDGDTSIIYLRKGNIQEKLKQYGEDAIKYNEEMVLLHETIHLLTVEHLNNNKEFNDKITKLREVALENLPQHSGWMKDNAEFIAEAYTNYEFQKALKTIEYDKSNIFNSFIELIQKMARFFNINIENSLLEKIIEITENYTNTTKQQTLQLHKQTKDALALLTAVKEGKISMEDLTVKDNIENKEVNKDEINYVLKSISILQSDKAKQIFEKANKNNWNIDKILQELAISKEQKQLVIDSYNEGNKTPEQLAIDIASKYSYSVEIKIAKEIPTAQNMGNEFPDFDENGDIIPQGTPIGEERNSQYYYNLTVPGGTNYTENRIITPQIIPSIKGHAQFAEENDVGWSRSDDRITYNMEHIDFVMNELEKSGQLKIKCD